MNPIKSRTKGRFEHVDFEYIDDLKTVPFSSLLTENEAFIKEMFADCSDFVIRRILTEKSAPALIVFIDGLVKTELLESAMQDLMIYEEGETGIDQLLERNLSVSQITAAENYGDFLNGVLSGDAGLVLEGNSKAVLLGIRGAQTRSVGEPETEAVVRGPREGFIENLRTNTSMVRRKIKSPRLKMKPLTIGKYSNTNVAVSYLEGLTDPELVEEVIGRLKKINTDIILESGFIEEFIQDSAYSPFPQMQYTERPDAVAAAIMQGRVAIFIDGTPLVLLAPTVFIHLLQATEDYYERFQMGTLIRWLRYVFLLLSVLTPATYVAVTTYHPELLPTTLLLSIAAAREAIPFPAVVEALIMEVIFEALREAGIRLPKAIGSAVSILGALVVGQAAVEAGIVSAPMVIVVSITGIASFTIPKFNGAIALRMLRFPLIIIASMFGIYGILVGAMLIIGHMANLRSFGVPYLAPIGPFSSNDIKDVVYRAPVWSMEHRPSFVNVQDSRRMGEKMVGEISQQGGMTGTSLPEADGRESGPNPGRETEGKENSDG